MATDANITQRIKTIVKSMLLASVLMARLLSTLAACARITLAAPTFPIGQIFTTIPVIGMM